MNIFEQHGLMLLAAEQGRQQLNRDFAASLRGWYVRATLAVRRIRRRLVGPAIRY